MTRWEISGFFCFWRLSPSFRRLPRVQDAGAHGSAALPQINEVRSLDMKYVILAVPRRLAVVVFLV